ncbi:glycosyltransferase family protein [Empedobacter stercoris]|uniref:hypothetical protein n=1 Tax=Empedobacter stercoris TaxID=1628248 RepID=UPI001CE03994|nr:hypothetical protein [Empedobacter stercoris]MCA4777335.1 hypothetical protein [Empedobacter stercoris]
MKTLITSQYNSKNTYVKDIVDELNNDVEIVTEAQNFWTSNIRFDIIHIQWPEELFSWRKIEESDLHVLERRLNYHKQNGSKLVVTLHNVLPHRKHKLDQKLYEMVYNSADVIVNLGKFSTHLYPHKRNVIIQHPNYAKYYKVKPTESDRSVFLSFGTIRKKEEEQLIVDAFIKAAIKNSQLIVCNSIIGKNPYTHRKKDILKMYAYNFRLKKYTQKNIVFIPKYLSDQEVETYFNQAKVIISPRIDSLNSGVIYMGYTFGKVVVGAAKGNMKEVLEQNNNPTYQPNDFNSVVEALRQALVNKEIAKLNEDYALTFCNPKQIAQQHLDLYRSILKLN